MSIELRRPLVLLAHPGQELRLHGWIHRGQPRVWIWTDGSGPDTWPRPHTLPFECVEGSCRDSGAELHAALRSGEFDLFRTTLHRITVLLEHLRPSDLVTGAAEGINPLTDLLRHLAAVAVAEYRNQGHRIEHWESCVDGAPVSVTPIYGSHVDLKDQEYFSKLLAVDSYADLAPEYEHLTRQFGQGKLRREVIYRALPWVLPPRECAMPKYAELNFADHLWPMLECVDSRHAV